VPATGERDVRAIILNVDIGALCEAGSPHDHLLRREDRDRLRDLHGESWTLARGICLSPFWPRRASVITVPGSCAAAIVCGTAPIPPARTGLLPGHRSTREHRHLPSKVKPRSNPQTRQGARMWIRSGFGLGNRSGLRGGPYAHRATTWRSQASAGPRMPARRGLRLDQKPDRNPHAGTWRVCGFDRGSL